MAAINATQDAEVSYITGVAADGTVAATSFWTWNEDTPATYGAPDDEAKWGQPVAGTESGAITYAFDPASNWTPTEQNAFVATMALWSDVANVTFVQASAPSAAEVDISRASDHAAEGGVDSLYRGTVGSSNLGAAVSGEIKIDTSVAGFGPLGASFSDYGGYPWLTLLHEEGHVLGLGHGGAYNEGDTTATPQYTAYDSRAWTIMSYNDPSSAYQWGLSTGDNGLHYGAEPTTWQPLDVASIQRIYGLPTSTPLSGGQTFGFHSNVAGPTGMFFDFTVNTKPIVTLWDEGAGNTFDASGFTTSSTIDLNQGASSSVAGLVNNIAIAYGARIDAAVTGTGADLIVANPDGDTLIAGAGQDTVVGGVGADLIYGNAGADSIVSGGGADTIYGGADNDTLVGGSGASYLSGDNGDDLLTGGAGADTLLGGFGNDTLVGGPGHELLFGNGGNDHIDLTAAGASTAYGGQGDDVITAAGNPNAQQINGDAGDDVLTGGAGADSLLGGDGNDTVNGGSGAAQLFGNAGNDVLNGGTGADTIYGGQGNDVITAHSGGVGALLHGDLGDDTITGAAGPDTIFGGAGADVLSGRGGANVFVYSALSDSTAAAPDRILDFNPSVDHVDLTALSAAQTAAGNPAFSMVAAFDHHPDEIELSYNAAANQTAVLIDANGDGAADFSILLNGHVAAGGWLLV